MAALSADRQTMILATDAMRSGRGDVAANTKIYFGSVIARNAAGYVVPASDTVGLKVIGIAQQTVDNTGGADGALTCTYVTCVTAELDNNGSSVVQANKHSLVYAMDDHSVAPTGSTAHQILVGTVTKFDANVVRVFIDERANA